MRKHMCFCNCRCGAGFGRGFLEHLRGCPNDRQFWSVQGRGADLSRHSGPAQRISPGQELEPVY